jgi:hypothetical protein
MQDNLYRCKSYLGYSVTENGKVFSHRTRRGIKGKNHAGSELVIDYNYKRLLKPTKNNKGYLSLTIKVNNKLKSRRVHSLVLDAFYEKPFQNAICRHLDGNCLNNHYTNLKWGTLQENAADRKTHGTYYRGHEHCNSKLTLEQATYIKQSKNKVRLLAEIFNVSISTIEGIRYGKTYKNIEVVK